MHLAQDSQLSRYDFGFVGISAIPYKTVLRYRNAQQRSKYRISSTFYIPKRLRFIKTAYLLPKKCILFKTFERFESVNSLICLVMFKLASIYSNYQVTKYFIEVHKLRSIVIYLQGHPKEFFYITANGKKNLLFSDIHRKIRLQYYKLIISAGNEFSITESFLNLK